MTILKAPERAAQSQIVGNIKTRLEEFKKVLQLFGEIVVIMREQWIPLSVVALILISYAGAAWYVIDYPGQQIRRYYSAIENKHIQDEAWDMMFPSYRSKIWSLGPIDFERGFATTIAYSDFTISPKASHYPWDVFGVAMAGSAEYEVKFTVVDRFTRQDFGPSQQHDDLPYLEIEHRRTFSLLRDDKIGNSENPTPSLDLTRTYHKDIQLLHERGTWLIAKNVTRDVTVVPGTD